MLCVLEFKDIIFFKSIVHKCKNRAQPGSNNCFPHWWKEKLDVLDTEKPWCFPKRILKGNLALHNFCPDTDFSHSSCVNAVLLKVERERMKTVKRKMVEAASMTWRTLSPAPQETVS